MEHLLIKVSDPTKFSYKRFFMIFIYVKTKNLVFRITSKYVYEKFVIVFGLNLYYQENA